MAALFTHPAKKAPARKPTLVFTLASQWRSVAVIDELRKHEQAGAFDIQVFDTDTDVQATFANGHSPDRSVALFDGAYGNLFTFLPRGRGGITFPSWSAGSLWGVSVTKRNKGRGELRCANQIAAHFDRHFERQLEGEEFPWGPPRKGEGIPMQLFAPDDLPDLIERLNDGPDLRNEIDAAHAAAIPDGIQFSWQRVPWMAAEYPEAKLMAALKAVSDFEHASSELLIRKPELGDELMVGVQLDPTRPELRDCYLQPHYGAQRVMRWSVRRPDMHVCGGTLVASENDEMPGGFPDLMHVDRAYGINVEAWTQAFKFLTRNGMLLFVISDEWSKVYISSTAWLVKQMQALGYNVHMVTTSEAEDRIVISDGKVSFDGEQVGTVWRQFPIFETTGRIADLVVASQQGKVQMVPEFGFFGNKTLFSFFWHHQEIYAELLDAETMAILQVLIPRSRMINPAIGKANFPFTIGQIRVGSLKALLNLNKSCREELVLKVTGANSRSARAYGILVGGARSEDDWKEWLTGAMRDGEAFIIQQRFEPSVENIAVYNVATKATEDWRCRVLMRPWIVGEQLVSIHTCCTPRETTVVHGRADMAIQPVRLV